MGSKLLDSCIELYVPSISMSICNISLDGSVEQKEGLIFFIIMEVKLLKEKKHSINWKVMLANKLMQTNGISERWHIVKLTLIEWFKKSSVLFSQWYTQQTKKESSFVGLTYSYPRTKEDDVLGMKLECCNSWYLFTLS